MPAITPKSVGLSEARRLKKLADEWIADGRKTRNSFEAFDRLSLEEREKIVEEQIRLIESNPNRLRQRRPYRRRHTKR